MKFAEYVVQIILFKHC